MERVQLPKYECHKIVEAMKIGAIHHRAPPSPGLPNVSLVSPEGLTVFVAESYVGKHNPKVGGYYVRYEDGYESWSPAAAFENGYTRIS